MKLNKEELKQINGGLKMEQFASYGCLNTSLVSEPATGTSWPNGPIFATGPYK